MGGDRRHDNEDPPRRNRGSSSSATGVVAAAVVVVAGGSDATAIPLPNEYVAEAVNELLVDRRADLAAAVSEPDGGSTSSLPYDAAAKEAALRSVLHEFYLLLRPASIAEDTRSICLLTMCRLIEMSASLSSDGVRTTATTAPSSVDNGPRPTPFDVRAARDHLDEIFDATLAVSNGAFEAPEKKYERLVRKIRDDASVFF